MLETPAPTEKTGERPKVITEVIKEGKLPLYEEAAEQTGYGVEVIARVGEEFLLEDKDNGILKGTFHTVKVEPGFVRIGITRPLGQEIADSTPFWDAVKELEQPPK